MRLDDFIVRDNEEYPMLTEGINDRGIFKAVMMAGIAGSGKSFVATKVKSGNIEPRIVNTDTWIEHYGNSYDKWVDTSVQLTKSQLTLYLNSMLPLLCDTTSTSFNTVLRRLQLLERFGYDVAMVYVHTSLETALARIARRERKVPEWQVIEYFEKAKKIKPYLKNKFQLFLEVKNDDGELTDEVIQKVFKRTLSFYESDIQNPLGVEAVKMMQENGWKYLSPNIYELSDIKEMAGRWYSK